MPDEFIVNKIREKVKEGETMEDIKESLSLLYSERDIDAAYKQYLEELETEKVREENREKLKDKVGETTEEKVVRKSFVNHLFSFVSNPVVPVFLYILAAAFLSYNIYELIDIGNAILTSSLFFVVSIFVYWVTAKFLAYMANSIEKHGLVKKHFKQSLQFVTLSFFIKGFLLWLVSLIINHSDIWLIIFVVIIPIIEIFFLTFLFVTSLKRAVFMWFMVHIAFWGMLLIAQFLIGYVLLDMSIIRYISLS